MGERIRSFDWSETPLGPSEAWPQSLKTAVGIMLDSRYPMQGNGVPVEPESGEGSERARTVVDIGERRQAEDALRFHSEQVELLLSQAPLGVYLVDADFRIRQVNPVARPIFGDIPGGVVGRDFDEIIHILWESEYADEVARIFRHTLETGESFISPERAEFRIDRGVTEYYEWRIDRITLPDGRYGLVCYLHDTSAHVQDRAAIAESEELHRRAAIGLRAIAARAHCLLWYAEVEDRGEPALHWTLRMADEEAARRFLPVEVPPGNSYGRALADARLPEDRAHMAWGDQEVRAGRSYRQEFRVHDADGHIRWLAEDVQIEAIDPNLWYAVGICIDITERKRAEEEREKHHAEIETLNFRLQRAMAETHHRVKNNLQVVAALVDLQTMIDRPAVPIEELLRIGRHIRSLAAIHDLLTQNAKDNGTSDSVLTREVMDKLAPLLRTIVGDRIIRFDVEDISLPQRQGTSLAVLVNELVSNAVKHGVDVFMPVGAAKLLGQLDAFVQHHAPRHVRAVLEFIGANPHHAVFDGRNLSQFAVQQRHDKRVKICGLFDAPAKQRVKVHRVRLIEPRQVARESINVLHRVFANQVLVKRLQRELARAGAVGFAASLACAGAGQPGAGLAGRAVAG